ncbi:uncharacterized protein BDR25DRAFT_357039 [Lindgomyces ingoldianus]|uniref:Uncharacterized protein n=1 Tax=Lindgomyces ingoldianus TaxID=673940 RepID=A0ACB6QRH8_9PLEO|nr:uncharacterized protein BDR25DRAFT_357039 [Lindgomyces ingoldianus]KAF2468682.1 hypothetical protein BDR25DRAFT_357039 [Lindgomyces ingoldianus]
MCQRANFIHHSLLAIDIETTPCDDRPHARTLPWNWFLDPSPGILGGTALKLLCIKSPEELHKMSLFGLYWDVVGYYPKPQIGLIYPRLFQKSTRREQHDAGRSLPWDLFKLSADLQTRISSAFFVGIISKVALVTSHHLNSMIIPLLNSFLLTQLIWTRLANSTFYELTAPI